MTSYQIQKCWYALGGDTDWTLFRSFSNKETCMQAAEELKQCRNIYCFRVVEIPKQEMKVLSIFTRGNSSGVLNIEKNTAVNVPPVVEQRL